MVVVVVVHVHDPLTIHRHQSEQLQVNREKSIPRLCLSSGRGARNDCCETSASGVKITDPGKPGTLFDESVRCHVVLYRIRRTKSSFENFAQSPRQFAGEWQKRCSVREWENVIRLPSN